MNKCQNALENKFPELPTEADTNFNQDQMAESLKIKNKMQSSPNHAEVSDSGSQNEA